MTSRRLPECVRRVASAIAVCCACLSLWAQGAATGALPNAPSATPSLAVLAASPVILPSPLQPGAPVASEHRFWDKQNVALFTASAALSVADFAVTRANLRSGAAN
ncbi:MAG TPA: hypothetical protein VMQ17_24890 [Candidatus Sulfotelmatobacter sp.]|nr:hypothetical protein [Candidatus Sulfotelmatobacter sp.]